MKQFITLYSQYNDSDFFTQKDNQHWAHNWAVCRDELEDFFELNDKPLEITVQLSDKPSKDSYPVTPNSGSTESIRLSSGEIKSIALTDFAGQALWNFNTKCGVSIETPVHVSIY